MKSKYLIIFCVIAVIFVSCTSTPTESALNYTWSNVDDASYVYLKKNDDESLEKLLAAYQVCVDASVLNGNPEFYDYKGNQVEIRRGTPPGICADYGYLLIKMGRIEEGKALMEKEIELYPESKTYLKKLLETLK